MNNEWMDETLQSSDLTSYPPWIFAVSVSKIICDLGCWNLRQAIPDTFSGRQSVSQTIGWIKKQSLCVLKYSTILKETKHVLSFFLLTMSLDDGGGPLTVGSSAVYSAPSVASIYTELSTHLTESSCINVVFEPPQPSNPENKRKNMLPIQLFCYYFFCSFSCINLYRAIYTFDWTKSCIIIVSGAPLLSTWLLTEQQQIFYQSIYFFVIVYFAPSVASIYTDRWLYTYGWTTNIQSILVLYIYLPCSFTFDWTNLHQAKQLCYQSKLTEQRIYWFAFIAHL